MSLAVKPREGGEFTDQRRGEPPRLVLHCELAADGRITAVYSVVSSGKLSATRFAFK